MIVRKFDNIKDYEDVVQWWKKHDWQEVPVDFLSNDGFIVETDTQKLAATWIFTTNSPIYIMEWTVANPEIDWQDRSASLELVTNTACDWAKQNGAKHVLTMSNSDRFINKLENFGFTKTDFNMTHLVRSL